MGATAAAAMETPALEMAAALKIAAEAVEAGAKGPDRARRAAAVERPSQAWVAVL